MTDGIHSDELRAEKIRRAFRTGKQGEWKELILKIKAMVTK